MRVGDTKCREDLGEAAFFHREEGIWWEGRGRGRGGEERGGRSSIGEKERVGEAALLHGVQMLS